MLTTKQAMNKKVGGCPRTEWSPAHLGPTQDRKPGYSKKRRTKIRFGLDRDPGIVMYLNKAPQWNTTTLTDNCIANPTNIKRTQIQDQYLLQLHFLTGQHTRHPFSYPQLNQTLMVSLRCFLFSILAQIASRHVSQFCGQKCICKSYMFLSLTVLTTTVTYSDVSSCTTARTSWQ